RPMTDSLMPPPRVIVSKLTRSLWLPITNVPPRTKRSPAGASAGPPPGDAGAADACWAVDEGAAGGPAATRAGAATGSSQADTVALERAHPCISQLPFRLTRGGLPAPSSPPAACRHGPDATRALLVSSPRRERPMDARPVASGRRYCLQVGYRS